MITILAPSENRVIRFAVGSRDRPTSFIWRLWTHDDDAYLLPFSRHEPKFSMHGRVWKIDVGTHRHDFAPITCPTAPSWVQGPVVMYCHVPYNPTPPTESILSEARTRKNIHWFDMPPEWHLREFVVFFVDADVDPTQLPPMDSTASSAQCVIGPLPLSDGRRVWLRSLSKEIPADRKDYLLGIRESLTGLKVDRSADELRSLGIIMHLHESTVVCVPFGIETIGTR